MNYSNIFTTISTLYNISFELDCEGIKRSLTLASTNCIPILFVNSIFDDEETPIMFVVFKALSKKEQDIEHFSIGSRLTIDSKSNRFFKVISGSYDS
ncbi:hypothetical protein GIB67_013718 [Kingdonia uniflora]|uniref:Uncharacterized protein n=1 Tax=Kingdonia uniflora TaxID=39325 RepID=A0A7J7NQT8_9MAGN|nr:hypothetical protein GIB67_013718 [Kingdonia uniflora]